MKVKELIQKFEDLGYDEETELNIGIYNDYYDWFPLDFTVDDDDRMCHPRYNSLTLAVEIPDNIIEEKVKNRFGDKLISFSEEIDALAMKYL